MAHGSDFNDSRQYLQYLFPCKRDNGAYSPKGSSSELVARQLHFPYRCAVRTSIALFHMPRVWVRLSLYFQVEPPPVHPKTSLMEFVQISSPQSCAVPVVR